MKRKLLAFALLACSIPVVANAAWNFTTWAKSAGGTISSRNNAAQTNLNGKIFKSYTTHASLPATVTAAPGYTISDITLNGASLGAQPSPWESALLISGGAGANVAQSLYATFKANLIPVTASVGAGGSVSPTVVNNVYYGKTTSAIVFRFSPNTNYKVSAIAGIGSFTVTPAIPAAINQQVTVTIPSGTLLTSAVNLVGSFISDVPIANAGLPQTVLVNSPATLSGTAVNGVFSKWSSVSRPNGAAEIATTATNPTTFTPAVVGDYQFLYRVADSAAAVTTIAVTDSYAAAALYQCVNCHNSAGIGQTPNVYDEWSASKHATVNMCYDCHNGANTGSHPGTLVDCTSCHTTLLHGVRPDCAGCHTPHKFNSPPKAPIAAKPLTVSNLIFGVDANNFITADFDLKTGATPVTGVTAAATSIYFAGLIPGTAASGSDEWKYWGSSTDALAETPAASGHYVLTTNRTLANAPAGSTKQRSLITINVSSTYERTNAVYDFETVAPGTPVAFGKDVVNDISCKKCHGYGVTIHGFGRNDTRACVVCHSPNYNATMAPYEIDMVTMVHKVHNGDGATNGAKATVAGNQFWAGHGDAWGVANTDPLKLPVKKFVYPGTMLDCANCHNSVAQADNWKTKPTMIACKSCHAAITFDGSAYNGIKSTPTVPVTGFLHNYTDNTFCVACHTSTGLVGVGGDMILNHPVPTSKKAELRSIQATVSGVVVDDNGGVTVSFSVVENGAPKTNLTAATFNLSRLVPADPANNKPSAWQSYLSYLKSSADTLAPIQNFAPVIQGRTETAATVGGAFSNLGAGNYSYKFALLNAEPSGDIRNVVKALNNNTTGTYSKTALPSMSYPVTYDPTVTHRVGVRISNNVADASFDFVPAGNVAENRNIVAWGSNGKSCNSCHGSSSIHAGTNDLKYCVGCHNANTYDPYSGPTDIAVPATTESAFRGSKTVALESIVHKIHMGSLLPSVKAGGEYTLNTEPGGTRHVYTKSQYPGALPALNPAGTTISRTSYGVPADCRKCHDESAPGMTEAANWKIAGPACFSCHDTQATTHGGSSQCNVCHYAADVADYHYGK